MPELPEVESLKREFETIAAGKPKVREVIVRRFDLRTPIAKNLSDVLKGQHFVGIRRRAKYLLLDFTRHTVISHLGMSGSWRLSKNAEMRKHDHVEIHFGDDRGGVAKQLIYHDPRRFGILEIVEHGGEKSSKWLKHLGLEPFAAEFTAERIRSLARGRDTAIKTFLMDQRVLVGVGNIYASEALFIAGVKPSRKISRVTGREWKKIIAAIRQVLERSIHNGGTTLKDYMKVDGSTGNNRRFLNVYDRAGNPCRRCRTAIKATTIVGRSTYWCPRCQK